MVTNQDSLASERNEYDGEDFKKFIADTNPDLTEDEVTQIYGLEHVEQYLKEDKAV